MLRQAVEQCLRKLVQRYFQARLGETIGRYNYGKRTIPAVCISHVTLKSALNPRNGENIEVRPFKLLAE